MILVEQGCELQLRETRLHSDGNHLVGTVSPLIAPNRLRDLEVCQPLPAPGDTHFHAFRAYFASSSLLSLPQHRRQSRERFLASAER